MSRLDKFLFDTDFDEEPPMAGTASAAPPRPTPADHHPNTTGQPEANAALPEPSDPDPVDEVAETATAAARQEAFEEGRCAGRAEAAEATEQSIAGALAGLPDALAAIEHKHAALAEGLSGNSLHAAVEIVRKLFPYLAKRHGLGEIEAVIADCLKRIPREPRVVVRVQDVYLDALKKLVDPIVEAAAFDGKLVLIADEDLAPGDVRVEWADGGSERDSSRFWQELDCVIGQFESGGQERPQSETARRTREVAAGSNPRGTPRRSPNAAPVDETRAQSASAPDTPAGPDQSVRPAAVHKRLAIGAR